jgi:hypothetical protein
MWKILNGTTMVRLRVSKLLILMVLFSLGCECPANKQATDFKIKPYYRLKLGDTLKLYFWTNDVGSHLCLPKKLTSLNRLKYIGVSDYWDSSKRLPDGQSKMVSLNFTAIKKGKEVFRYYIATRFETCDSIPEEKYRKVFVYIQ